VYLSSCAYVPNPQARAKGRGEGLRQHFQMAFAFLEPKRASVTCSLNLTVPNDRN
jgi:hypothetical protein